MPIIPSRSLVQINLANRVDLKIEEWSHTIMPKAMLTSMEEYLFDLRGYLVLRGALAPDQVRRINTRADELLSQKPDADGWIGCVQRHGYSASDGINLQNIIEGGEPFEELIDHPMWIEHAGRYVDAPYESGLFIDESFFNVRGPGEGLYMHSGGWKRRIRTQFAFHNESFHCGQINMLTALSNIGPGDGATTLIPGSHKSNIQHPQVKWPELRGPESDRPAADIEGAIEVFLEAGDTLLFVDSICHGAVERTNPGERRILVYRYGPGWGQSRLGYQPSAQLLERLTPARRKIVQPIAPRFPGSGPS